jgi:ribosome-binding protein aMBF1 (putative translation factor)
LRITRWKTPYMAVGASRRGLGALGLRVGRADPTRQQPDNGALSRLSFNGVELLRDADVGRISTQLAGHLGRRVHEERTRRGWTLRELAGRSGVSPPQIHWLEAGHAGSLATYVRISAALGLALDFELVDRRRRRAPVRQEDPVHAAMGECLARRLSGHGLTISLDEPFQHYQFAGRADLLAWSVPRRALLHIENRTRFPNLQEAFGSYNAKRAYLPAIVAERIGVPRFECVSHVIVALWSSEVLHSIRLHTASFRAVCPDPPEAFEAWWSGSPPSPGRATSVMVVFDPISVGRRRQLVGLDGALVARPRYRDYRHAAEALRGTLAASR